MKKRGFVPQNLLDVKSENVTSTKDEGVERQTSREKTIENRLPRKVTCPATVEEPWYFVHI